MLDLPGYHGTLYHHTWEPQYQDTTVLLGTPVPGTTALEYLGTPGYNGTCVHYGTSASLGITQYHSVPQGSMVPGYHGVPQCTTGYHSLP